MDLHISGLLECEKVVFGLLSVFVGVHLASPWAVGQILFVFGI
jgi:hypothetical protein